MHAAPEFLRRRGRLEPAYIETQFPEQRAFCEDPSKTVSACCARRSGKSWGLGSRLLLAAERHPAEMSVYIAQTKNNARMIVGRALMSLNRTHGLGLRMKEIDQRLMVIHPNGHHIWLAGAKHREAFEDFRGHKFAEVQVDEAQFHGMYLQEAVEEILEPSLGDLDGAIVLTGTPSPIPVGFFHAVTTGQDTDGFGNRIPKWSSHHWTMAENVFFRGGKGEAYREEIRQRRGWSESHPTYLREYWGQWVHDPNALFMPYNSDLNSFRWGDHGAPPMDPAAGRFDGWVYVVACDLGASLVERSTAFVVLAYHRNDPEMWVLESSKRAGLIPSQIAAQLERLRQTYRPGRMVVDAGALGAGYAREFQNVWNLPIEPAEKQMRAAAAELLRGNLQSGQVKIRQMSAGDRQPPNADLIAEMSVAQWNEDHTDADDRFEIHAIDGLMYGCRAASPNYRPTIIDAPEPGSPEWVNRQVTSIKADREKEIAQRARKRGKQTARLR